MSTRLRFCVIGLAVVCWLGALAPDAAYAGKKVDGFEAKRAYQETPVWCWAACIQMCLGTAGVDVSQSDIVTRNYGRPIAATATSMDQIRLNLEMVFPAFDGVVRIDPDHKRRALRPSEVIRAIDDDSLIIAGVGGSPFSMAPPQHVVIVYGYEQDAFGNLLLHVFDPMPSFMSDRVTPYSTEGWKESIVVEVKREGGRDHDPGDRDCSRCDGRGSVDCGSCQGGERRCRGCGGSGASVCAACRGRCLEPCMNCGGQGGGTVICGYCGGTGRYGYGICANCGGRGGAIVPCRVCGGSGGVPCRGCGGRGAAPCGGCFGSGSVPCDRCDGMGERDCPRCG